LKLPQPQGDLVPTGAGLVQPTFISSLDSRQVTESGVPSTAISGRSQGLAASPGLVRFQALGSVILRCFLINTPPGQRRPFYTDFAWAYDLLIDRPVVKECGVIVTWLIERGARPGALLLDAGCGTGRYSIELSRRGYVVHGIDAAPELIVEAKRTADSLPGSASFSVGDILTLPANRYDAILCRGVLNDFIGDLDRTNVFLGFARALRPTGVLILDVREWDATALRKAREPLFKKSVPTDHGKLTFTSVTQLDPENRCLLISERHSLDDGCEERSFDHSFVMRCWQRDEVHSHLGAHGFTSIAWFGAYDPAIAPGSTDRLVVVAQLGVRSDAVEVPQLS
jgi:SAM-dependent methyltransferase